MKTDKKNLKTDYLYLSCFSSSSLVKTNVNYIDRKKQLNRIAATKYRKKKRAERESVSSQMKNLDLYNIELRSEISSVQSEINYLKNLLKEINTRKEKI